MLPIFLILFAFSCNWIYLSVLNLELTEVVMGTLWLWNVLLKFFFTKLLKVKLYCCSVTKLCPTLCDPMDCSAPGFYVLHHAPEFAPTHVHWVGDAIQPSDFFYMILKRKHYVVDIILGKRYKQLLFFLLQSVIRFAFFFNP